MSRSSALVGTMALLAATSTAATHAARSATNAERVVRVDEHFERIVAGNCTYRGSVRGTVQPLPVLSGSRYVYYQPSLTMNGAVDCPGGERHDVGERSLSTGQLTSEELARAINAQLRTTILHNGRRCVVTPSFAFDGSSLATAEPFSETCELARGGGPASVIQPTPAPKR